MKAFKITLQLVFKESGSDEERSGVEQIITVARVLSDAADYARLAFQEADGPLEEGYFWEVVSAEMIEGKVVLPAMEKVVPRT